MVGTHPLAGPARSAPLRSYLAATAQLARAPGPPREGAFGVQKKLWAALASETAQQLICHQSGSAVDVEENGLACDQVEKIFAETAVGKSAGCVVIEEDFGTARVDGLSQWVEDCPVILINARVPTDRKRLTLAHELGHLVMHSEHMTASPEQEANAFAAEFLMPAEMIRPELRNLTLGKLHDLKRSWMVSMQALIERAWNLKLLSASDRTRLYKQFGARGWRTREPVSDELPPELPRLAQEIGEALAARGLSTVEIARITGFSSPSDHNPFQPRPRRLHAL